MQFERETECSPLLAFQALAQISKGIFFIPMKKKFNPFDTPPKKKKKKTAGGKKAYLLAVKLSAERVDLDLF